MGSREQLVVGLIKQPLTSAVDLVQPGNLSDPGVGRQVIAVERKRRVTQGGHESQPRRVDLII